MFRSIECRKAFTLIELLIVVAIIAILAAIAVPNFLEAQTRAKVSRIVSDMRTATTGLESYRIDSNAYPPWADWRTTDAPGSNYLGDNALLHAKVPNFITTPIGYITSLAPDVFISKSTFSNTRYPIGSGVGFRFQYFPYGPLAKATPGLTANGRAEQTGGYLFYSFGPDQDLNALATAKAGDKGVYTRYDATNGTISLGNIIRTAASPEGSIPRNANITSAQNGQN